MIDKILILFLCCFNYILAVTPFIEKGQRAELFELTDHEVPIFRVTIPDNELELMLDVISPLRNVNITKLVEDFIKTYKPKYRKILEILKNTNFNEAVEEKNVNELLPELEIDSDGYPQFSVEDIMNETNFDVDHYVPGYKDDYNLEFSIVDSNPNFNINNVLYNLAYLTIKDESKTDPEFKELIYQLKKEYYLIDFDENNENNETNNEPNNEPNNENNETNINNNENDETNVNNNDNNLEFVDSNEFKTENATMIVEINGEKIIFPKITFSLGGQSTRTTLSKPGFNIKIGKKLNLYGRKQLRLRPHFTDPTLMRAKLITDIHNKLGMTTLSANYALLYLNDMNMGFYVLLDTYKKAWIETEFGDKNTTSLYKCDGPSKLSLEDSLDGCLNENKEVADNNAELKEFLTALDNANSPEDIEDIFDIDHFLTEIALEYLTGSVDRLIRSSGHNHLLYKRKDGHWMYLSQDFDIDFGIIDVNTIDLYYKFMGLPEPNVTDATQYSFAEFSEPLHIIETLILNNSTRFDHILKDIVTKVFNPMVLFPHIDEIKKFIKPYVVADKTPDADGNYPGVLKKTDPPIPFTLEEWDANTEFTMVGDITYGLKQWILGKYRYCCNAYNMECDPTYLDPNYPPLPENVPSKTDTKEETTNSPTSQPVTSTSSTSTSTTSTTSINSQPTHPSDDESKAGSEIFGSVTTLIKINIIIFLSYLLLF